MFTRAWSSRICYSRCATDLTWVSMHAHNDSEPHRHTARRRLANVVEVRLPGTHLRASANAGETFVAPGDHAVVETDKGPLLVKVESWVERKLLSTPDTRRVVRRATADDLARHADNARLAEQALRNAVLFARSRRVDIKFVTAELPLDRSRLYLYYALDERPDLRSFARDLAQALGGRIDLRQVGLREGAGVIGGIGPCGNELCCSSFLRNFESISLRFAKQQGLALHQHRITGMCGRLKCCLVYEAEAYKELKRHAPKPGVGVFTPQGPGEITEFDLISQKARVRLAGEGSAWFHIRELVVLQRSLTAEEIQAGTSRERAVMNRRRANRGLAASAGEGGGGGGGGGERPAVDLGEEYLWRDDEAGKAEDALAGVTADASRGEGRERRERRPDRPRRDGAPQRGPRADAPGARRDGGGQAHRSGQRGGDGARPDRPRRDGAPHPRPPSSGQPGAGQRQGAGGQQRPGEPRPPRPPRGPIAAGEAAAAGATGEGDAAKRRRRRRRGGGGGASGGGPAGGGDGGGGGDAGQSG